jgi:uncharacterized protein YdcH (DUF465 family)
MSVHHFKSLLFRSGRIQEAIEREQKRRWPDWMRLLKLKKLRLSIKDRISKMVRQSAANSLAPRRPRIVTDKWQGA